MKIDANSDGSVTWDEFSSYMMSGTVDADTIMDILDERNKRVVNAPHKDAILIIDSLAKDRKYMSIR